MIVCYLEQGLIVSSLSMIGYVICHCLFAQILEKKFPSQKCSSNPPLILLMITVITTKGTETLIHFIKVWRNFVGKGSLHGLIIILSILWLHGSPLTSGKFNGPSHNFFTLIAWGNTVERLKELHLPQIWTWKCSQCIPSQQFLKLPKNGCRTKTSSSSQETTSE